MTAKKPVPEVLTGQTWRNNFADRTVEIESVTQPVLFGPVYAMARNIETGRKSRIRIDQFNPNRKKGYTLLEVAVDA